MKLFTALVSLALLNPSNGLSCPAELTQFESVIPTYTFYYAIVTSSSEPSILCARIESQSEAWVGFGINPSGGMVNGEAIIGLPDEGTVRKYLLTSMSADGVQEMDEADQTLMDTSITQEDGVTIMSFTKYLDEDRWGIFESGRENSFIYAVGSGNELRYHQSRGNFRLEFEAEEGTSTSSTGATSSGATISTTATETTTPNLPAVDENATVAPTVISGATFDSPTYSPSAGETDSPTPLITELLVADNKTVAPTPSTVDFQATDSTSPVSTPFLRTAAPSVVSVDAEDDDLNGTTVEDDDMMIESNETVVEEAAVVTTTPTDSATEVNVEESDNVTTSSTVVTSTTASETESTELTTTSGPTEADGDMSTTSNSAGGTSTSNPTDGSTVSSTTEPNEDTNVDFSATDFAPEDNNSTSNVTEIEVEPEEEDTKGESEEPEYALGENGAIDEDSGASSALCSFGSLVVLVSALYTMFGL